MQNHNRVLTSILLTLSTIVFFATPGLAKDCATDNQKDPAVMVTDVTLARPVGTVATVAGFAFFVISSPFSALGGNSQEAWKSLVVSPADYTFKRPLGHFDCEQPPNKK